MKTLVRDGTLVTASKTEEADILIEDGKIICVKPGLVPDNGDAVIEAGGRYIFPGGVDPHVHMHLATRAGYSSDDFTSGTRTALFGGTTSIIDFVTPARGESLTSALTRRLTEAEKSLTDYTFHVSPVEWNKSTAEEIRDCIRLGMTSFKVYMAYKDTVGLDDADLAEVMKAVAPSGGIVTAHCERGDEIALLRDKFVREGQAAPLYHALSRPPEMEAMAIKRAVDIASQTGCPLYIVHVSAKESLRYIREAKERGQRLWAETCPQYLLLDDTFYKGAFDAAASFVISPPLRKKEDNDALWDALADGTVDSVGTDHCPFTMEQKRAGISDFRLIPGGAGGVEHRLSLLYTYGVIEGRISLNRMVDIFSTAPAKIFGLYPGKGEIIVGADADMVVWDPYAEQTISAKTHHQNCDTNIYEGMTVKGNADLIIAGGKVVIEKGVMVDSGRRGRLLLRTKVSSHRRV